MSSPEEPQKLEVPKDIRRWLAAMLGLAVYCMLLPLVYNASNSDRSGREAAYEAEELQALRAEFVPQIAKFARDAVPITGRGELKDILDEHRRLTGEPKPAATEPAVETPVDWSRVGSRVTLADATLEVVEATIGPAPFRVRLSSAPRELLLVRVRVTNTSSLVSVNYSGWNGDESTDAQGKWSSRILKLEDEFGNDYSRQAWRLRPESIIDGSTGRPLSPNGVVIERNGRFGPTEENAVSVPSGESVDGLLLFFVPIPQARELRLTLDGYGVGAGRQRLHLRFAPPDRAPAHRPGQRPAGRIPAKFSASS